ncbi:MAG: glycosyltransferase, partial [Atopobium sp.]|nr:glycosyltransferase [Atopobium sp.]
MKISVVIATYNGEKYILDQLTSLLDQCRQPEQVLIFDDCSTDNTPSLIKSFIEKNKLSGWNLIENEQNKGWRCNFWNGILISTGDIVFLCDQDDIWRRDKIQKMSEAMEDNSKIELLASGYTKLFDETGELDPMPEHMDIVQQAIYNNIFYVLLPGCTYCVRRSLIDQVAPYWEPETAHDEILWRFSLFSESLYVYRENFIKWRKHKNSAWS